MQIIYGWKDNLEKNHLPITVLFGPGHRAVVYVKPCILVENDWKILY